MLCSMCFFACMLQQEVSMCDERDDENFARALAGDTSFLKRDSLPSERLWLASFLSHAVREEAGPRGLAAQVANDIFVDTDNALVIRYGPSRPDGGLKDVLLLVEPEERAAFEQAVKNAAEAAWMKKKHGDLNNATSFTKLVSSIMDTARAFTGSADVTGLFRDDDAARDGAREGVIKLTGKRLAPVWHHWTDMWNDQRDNLQSLRESALLFEDDALDDDALAAELKARTLAYYASLLSHRQQLTQAARNASKVCIVPKKKA